ncbi:MAG: cupin domain-containing protein [Candidatus Dormibacteraeota bacterium]|nr:cupin domain-containing protein [Candidatus Dormibacteraeota bacterium]
MASTSTAVPVVRQDGEGDRLWFYGGGVHTWKATEKETGGAFILFEAVMSRGKVTPLHTHPCDETMIVLEGELLVHVQGEEYVVREHGVLMAPRGVPHAFMVTSQTARMLVLETPSGSEAFYRGASVTATDDLLAEAPVDMHRVQQSAQQHGGIEIVGPPPFAAK